MSDTLALFVHGLGSDPRRFWGTTIEALEAADALAGTDVQAWGYDTSPRPRVPLLALFTGRRLQSIEQLGQHLWSDLTNLVETNGYRSVLLFGHSMGGLVVAAAIGTGLRNGHDEKLTQALRGVALCATPAGGADLARKVAPIFKLFGKNVQVGDLRKDSPTRQSIMVDFIMRAVVTKIEDNHHHRIDLTLFRASADAIVSQSELIEPFKGLGCRMEVLGGSHSGCVVNLDRPDNANLQKIIRWVEHPSGPAVSSGSPVPQTYTSAHTADDAAPGSLPPLEIRVLETSDGASIAYWEMGSGTPLILLPAGLPFSNVELELENPLTREWYERLARKYKVVRYDARGSGLSHAGKTRLSLETYVRDVEAVVGHYGDEKVALFGGFHAGPVAMSYAAANSEKVSHLILWCTYAEGSAFWGHQEVQALNGLLDADFTAYTETVAAQVVGWEDDQVRRNMAHFLRQCVGQEAVKVALAAIRGFDVSNVLAEIRVPTLVFHQSNFRFFSRAEATRVVGRINGARLETFEGEGGLPYSATTQAPVDEIERFLDQDRGTVASSTEATPPAGGSQ